MLYLVEETSGSTDIGVYDTDDEVLEFVDCNTVFALYERQPELFPQLKGTEISDGEEIFDHIDADMLYKDLIKRDKNGTITTKTNKFKVRWSDSKIAIAYCGRKNVIELTADNTIVVNGKVTDIVPEYYGLSVDIFGLSPLGILILWTESAVTINVLQDGTLTFDDVNIVERSVNYSVPLK